ncbi:uncharacterized protein VTP21DRAFT_2457 [Calcarisporiella thermophila]|uniref:uncharacterized protein n=1 Tax=Calcarisporiella thermophila TaxID=911321 RepID=UPI003742E511
MDIAQNISKSTWFRPYHDNDHPEHSIIDIYAMSGASIAAWRAIIIVNPKHKNILRRQLEPRGHPSEGSPRVLSTRIEPKSTITSLDKRPRC